MYKLIALDMDGTLLREDKTISEATKKAIDEARAKGVKVVLASGRPLDGLKPYLEELDMYGEDDFVICFNGAQVQKTKSKEIISRKGLKGSNLKEVYQLSKDLGINIHAFSKDGCITPIITKYTELEGKINGIPVTVCDFNTFDEEEEIIKVMIVDEPETIDATMAKIPEDIRKKYTIVKSAPFFCEFLNPEVNKGVGVEMLCHHLDIDPKEVITMGDAGNDAHMVEFAGMGIAMGNAFPELKEIANYITKTNEEDGVAYAINKFVLNR